jgi:acyl-CoA synthetase (AMP-forming)/AMP-acid ligase II
MVAYTHAMLQQACLLLKSAYRISSIDNFFTYQSSLSHPFYFIHGLLLPFMNGATITITDFNTPEDLAKELLEAKVTRILLRGTVMEEWLNAFKAMNLKIPTLRSLTPEFSPLSASFEPLAK